MISLDLSLDGQARQIQLPSQQFESVYKPIMQQIVELQQMQQRRVIIGIAGPPGCGKTFFSKLLTTLLNRNSRQEVAVGIGMDGWHFSQQQLDTMTICREGTWIPLQAIKGAPESFDVQAFLNFLAQLRSTDELTFPVYDRNIHNPVNNMGHIHRHHQIVLLEGNYLLLNEMPWNEIQSFLDLSCFLWAGEKLRWQTLLKRHLSGGKSPAQALKHIRDVDMPNARRIGQPPADIGISRISEKELVI